MMTTTHTGFKVAGALIAGAVICVAAANPLSSAS